MKIQVSQLPEGQNCFQWNSDKEPGLGEFYKHQKSQGYDLTGPISLSMDLTRLEPDYYLRAKLAFALQQNCSLCGEPVQVKVDAPFELALLRTDKRKSGTARLAEEADDLDLVCFAGNELVLDPILEEQFVLNVPLQAECKTAECLERSRLLLEKVHEKADHWKDKNSPFSVLEDLKKKK